MTKAEMEAMLPKKTLDEIRTASMDRLYDSVRVVLRHMEEIGWKDEELEKASGAKDREAARRCLSKYYGSGDGTLPKVKPEYGMLEGYLSCISADLCCIRYKEILEQS